LRYKSNMVAATPTLPMFDVLVAAAIGVN
jgi:hypothetical protein